MSLTLNLPPEMEAKFTAEACALGMGLDDYLRSLLQQHVRQLSASQAGGEAGWATRRDLTELTWLAHNRQRYAGRWVALQDDTLLAVGDSAREVYAAVARHPGTPLVTRIDPDEQVLFAGW